MKPYLRPQAHLRHAPAFPQRQPKVVSEMLGHFSVAIMLDTYSQVLPNMQQSAVRALEEALK